jgi:hypothetical protein
MYDKEGHRRQVMNGYVESERELGTGIGNRRVKGEEHGFTTTG